MLGFCSIFGAVFRKFLFQVAVLRFYQTKRFTVFRNFRVISMMCGFSYVILNGVYRYFCVVLRYSYHQSHSFTINWPM